ncbi:hypothetical protein ACKKBG_A21630 [Auxenochlorella protothecoides x Auxenochlorella symbiontica]
MSQNGFGLKEVVLLTLLNPAPTPVGPAPPPPLYGSITGSITKSGNTFRFSVNFGANKPDGVNSAFFAATGGVITVSTASYSGNPMSWSINLSSKQAALASYAQVVAYTTGGGTSDTLTLNW